MARGLILALLPAKISIPSVLCSSGTDKGARNGRRRNHLASDLLDQQERDKKFLYSIRSFYLYDHGLALKKVKAMNLH